MSARDRWPGGKADLYSLFPTIPSLFLTVPAPEEGQGREHSRGGRKETSQAASAGGLRSFSTWGVGGKQ